MWFLNVSILQLMFKMKCVIALQKDTNCALWGDFMLKGLLCDRLVENIFIANNSEQKN